MLYVMFVKVVVLAEESVASSLSEKQCEHDPMAAAGILAVTL